MFKKFHVTPENHALTKPHNLHQSHFDVLICPSKYVTHANELAPMTQFSYDLYVNAPEPELSSTYFLDVFSNNLWMCIGSIWIVIILLLILYHRLNRMSLNLFLSSVMDTFGVSSTNDLFRVSGTISLNMTKFYASAFCFFVASSLSAFLISELSTIRQKYPFTGLSDFWNQNEFPICIYEKNDAYHQLLYIDPEKRLLNSRDCHLIFEDMTVPLIHGICKTKRAVYLAPPQFIMWIERNFGERFDFFKNFKLILLNIIDLLLILQEMQTTSNGQKILHLLQFSIDAN